MTIPSKIPEAQAAVAPQHERQSAARQGPVDAIRCLQGHVHDEAEVLLPGVLGVRPKGDRRQVAKSPYNPSTKETRFSRKCISAAL